MADNEQGDTLLSELLRTADATQETSASKPVPEANAAQITPETKPIPEPNVTQVPPENKPEPDLAPSQPESEQVKTGSVSNQVRMPSRRVRKALMRSRRGQEPVGKSRSELVDVLRAMNWDVIGLSSVAITLVGAAVLYISGWFYISSWYGFFEIDASQIGLNPYNIMIEGFNGLLIVVVILSLSIIISSGTISLHKDLKGGGIPFKFMMFMTRPFLNFRLVSVSSFLLASMIIICLYIYQGGLNSWNLVFNSYHRRSIFICFLILLTSISFFIYSSLSLFKKSNGLNVLYFVILLLNCIFNSSFIGEISALNMTRGITGNITTKGAYIITQREMSMFQNREYNISNNIYHYGPFLLLASNEQFIFLSDWEPSHHRLPPNTYMIPQDEIIQLSFLDSPPTSPLP